MGIAYDGIVLTGGRSARMGGRPKPQLEVGGCSLLNRALDALARARRVVVVGPGGDLCEDPPFSGPVAALAAGLGRVTAPVVVVLAADLPFVTRSSVDALVGKASAVALDDAGRPQYLLAAYRTRDLAAALPAQPAGAALRSVVAAIAPHPVRLEGSPPPWWDCDTPGDLARARSWT